MVYTCVGVYTYIAALLHQPALSIPILSLSCENTELGIEIFIMKYIAALVEISLSEVDGKLNNKWGKINLSLCGISSIFTKI